MKEPKSELSKLRAIYTVELSWHKQQIECLEAKIENIDKKQEMKQEESD